MKKNIVLFMFVVFSVLFVSGCINKTNQSINKDENKMKPIQNDDTKKQEEISNEIKNAEINQIGGQRDDYGCLNPAGYSYDEEIMACTRNWEITEDLKRPAKIAVEISSYSSLTVIEVLKMDCEGCFTVKLQRNNIEDPEKQYYTVELKNWKVVN
ncbi:MAG: hypothetical protein PHZ07_04025 [Patescibacteria group bacterium]|nr:hypothetical protein [Patescibacteria group bacterium]MDD4304479.1 hypothetical protein [Patescibacteria group bacterium]MDD4694839.1 hypothetical protein [Patescibacteria group bacterium]